MPTLDLPISGRRSGTGAISFDQGEPLVVSLPANGRRATVGGIRLRTPLPPPAPADRNRPAITAELWNETDTAYIADLGRSNGKKWTDNLAVIGSAELSVPIGTDAERVAANQLASGRHIRFRYRDRPAFSARIESTEATRIHRDHGLLRAKVNAADKRVVLDRHKVKSSWPIGAPIDTDQRTFGWHSKELSTVGWKNAYRVQPTISLAWQLPNTNPPWFQPWEPPKGWASLFTPIIQPRPGVVMPAGRWGARTALPVFSPGWHMIQLAVMGGRAELFLNSTKVAESAEDANGWLIPVEVTVPLTGSVEIAVQVEKFDYPMTGDLPGTLANFYRRSLISLAVYRLPNGPATTVLEGLKTLQTTNTWKVLDYPARFPAPTVGRIIRQLVQETDGLPSNFELGFSDTHDSAGRLWPLNDETTFRSSDSIWDALAQLRNRGYESRMSGHGYRLDVWGPEPFTAAVPIKVTEATQDERPVLPNRFNVTWSRGRFTVERPASERYEEQLNLGDVKTRQEAAAIANAELDRNEVRADSWRATSSLRPNDGLYDSWGPKSWVNVAGNGQNNDLRLVGVTVSEDSELNPSARLELSSPLELLDEELSRRIDRVGPAKSASSSLVRWLDPGVRSGFVQVERISEFSQGRIVKFPEEGGDSTVHTFDMPTRISLIRITAVSNPGSPGIFVRVRRNAENIAPILWLSPGSNHAVYLPNYLVFLPGQTLSVRMIDAPEGAGLVSVSFHAAVASPGAVRPERPFPWL